MDRKKLIITLAIIITIIILAVIIIKVKDSNNSSSSQSSELSSFKNAREALESSLENSKLFYKDDKDFYTYFKKDFIKSYLQGYELIFVDNIDIVDFRVCEIYNTNGNKIDEFPYEKVKKVSRDNLVIEPDQDCIIKLYSRSEETAYYFILNISETGEYKITDLCYTVGEIVDIDSAMEYETTITDMQ